MGYAIGKRVYGLLRLRGIGFRGIWDRELGLWVKGIGNGTAVWGSWVVVT